jgi:MFS family permease
MKVFKNPWWIVFGCVVGLFVGNGAIMQFTFPVLLKPIGQELGWSRATVSSAMVFGLVATGIMTPMVGHLVDRYGIRRIALPAITLFALATAAVSLVPSSPAAYIALYTVMGLFAAGQTPLIYAKSISAHFDDQRGLALGIAMAGVGLGAALMPPITQFFIDTMGWRGAYLGLGIMTFVLAIPAVSLFVREPGKAEEQSAAARDVGRDIVLPGVSGMEALKSSVFWLLAVPFFIVAAAANGTIGHVVALLTDRGVSPQVATSALTMAGFALILGRLVAGWLLDRLFAPYVAVVFFIAPLIGISLLFFTSSTAVATVATVLIGVGLGAEVDLIAFLISRYLGLRAFGQIYGYLFAIFMLANGIGPFVMGLSFDKAGSYNPVLIGFAVALIVAVALVLQLGPYAYPARHRKGGAKQTAPAPAE